MAAVTAGAGLLAFGPAASEADTVPALRAKATALQSAEQSALLQLYAAESSLARARAEEERLAARSRALAVEERLASRRTGIVARSLAASQSRLARVLRLLYIQGDVDPIAVILGAASLDELVTGLESLDRAADQNKRLARMAEEQTRVLRGLRQRLAGRRLALDAARTDAHAASAHLADVAARRAATLALLRRAGAITKERLAALQERAQAAQRASVMLSAETAATPSASSQPAAAVQAEPVAAAPVLAGDRTLVVDAVAYHLPGNTASGLPVGPGVIAVDPSVIPLGTRVFVPGYGAAVAADTGTAIRGNIIDLWMPSTARARAWGRRTVTITVYGS